MGKKMSDTSGGAPASPRAAPQGAPAAATPQQAQLAQLQAMLRAPVPRIYSNGLAIASSSSDVTVVLLQHGTPAGILSMSYATAKSLVKDLGGAILTFETNSNQQIKDIREATAEMAKHTKK